MAVVESYDLKVLAARSKEILMANIVAVVAVVANVTDVAAIVNQCHQKKISYHVDGGSWQIAHNNMRYLKRILNLRHMSYMRQKE